MAVTDSRSVPNPKPVNRMQPIVAWRAMKALLKDKEDTAQVFRIIRALGGGEFKRNFRRFAASDVGQKVLTERRELMHVLSDRDALAAMPEGSLGRAYLRFVQAEDLSAEGLADASAEGGDGRGQFSEDEDLFRRRIRDMHDLWHVSTGYGRDEIGELALLAFSYSQLRNLGVRFIIWMGGRQARQSIPEVDIKAAVREGFRHGREAPWLPALDWEYLLTRPLSEVRETIGYQRQDKYLNAVGQLTQTDRPGYETNPLDPLPAAA